MRCVKCNGIFDYLKSINQRCDECKTETLRLRKEKIVLESKLKYPDGADPNEYVECGVCGFRSIDLGVHLKIHDMSSKEHKEKYGPVKSENARKKICGENNPGFNHGGRLSPFSKNFIHYKSDEAISELAAKAQISRNENNNNNTKLEYYIKRGATEIEANKLLAERQTTFSLETCQEKYGLEEGLIKWQERQDKWQDNLKSKPNEEKSIINSKKGMFGFDSLWKDDLHADISGYFYIISFDNEIKIGITSKNSILKRYGGLYKDDDINVDLFKKVTNIKHAFCIEQLLLDKYRINITRTGNEKYKKFGRYEILTNIKSEEIINSSMIYIDNVDFCFEEFKKLKEKIAKK